MYDVVKAVVNIKNSTGKIKPPTINAFWHKLWPAVVGGTEIPHINIAYIVDVAGNVERNGFDLINDFDGRHIIYSLWEHNPLG